MSFNQSIYLLVFILLLLPFDYFQNSLIAQETDVISSDRPGQSSTPSTLKPKEMQFESGFYYMHLYTQVLKSQFNENENDYFTNNAFRYGIAEDFEFNFSLNYIRTDISTIYKLPPNNKTTAISAIGLDNLDLGFRYRFFNEDEDFLNFTILSTFGIYESQDFAIPDNPLFINFIMSKSFTENISFTAQVLTIEDINLQSFKNSFDYNDYTLMLNLSYNFSDYFGVFVEQYSFYTDEKPSHNLDFGINYMTSDDLQLDLYTGTRIIEDSDKNININTFFIGTGISYRIQNQ